MNDLLGSDDDMAHQQKEDEANITESSSDDDDADAFGRQYYATDNERPTTSGGDGEDTEWDDLYASYFLFHIILRINAF